LAVAVFLLAAVVLGPGCEPTQRDLRPVLLYAADNQGVLAACGCPSNPSGGLAKRQGLLEQYRRTRRHVLIVDAGDVVPDFPHPVKVKYLAMALSRAAYDAIGLGDQELALGVDRLRELARTYALPFVCANVRDSGGEYVVPPHVVRDVGGRRVGIFSVVADEEYGWPPLEWRKGLKVEPPAEAARREVAALADCDVVVALAHLPMDEARALARDVPGIHVVVCGHEPKTLQKPESVGDGIVVATGEAGRILGALTFEGRDGDRPRLVNELSVLSARVPDAPWVMDLYWKYVEEAKDAPPPDWNLTPIPPRYETAEACKECHEPEYKHWLTTHHARAYASIKRVGRHRDPECLLCHTMGLGRPGGFVSMAKTPDLGRVTCQGCHIVTTDHEDKKVDARPEIYISSRLCMSCHGPVQSPDFDYFIYKPKIVHPKPAQPRK